MSKSTPLYDDSPALVGGQSKLPDVVQKAIIKKKAKAVKNKEKTAAHGAEYDDSHMLSKSLERLAAQAKHLQYKINCGLVLPSWAEYKIYKAYDSINSALGASYPGNYPMGADTSNMMGGPSSVTVKEANSRDRAGKALEETDRRLKKLKGLAKKQAMLGQAEALNETRRAIALRTRQRKNFREMSLTGKLGRHPFLGRFEPDGFPSGSRLHSPTPLDAPSTRKVEEAAGIIKRRTPLTAAGQKGKQMQALTERAKRFLKKMKP